MKMTKRIMAVLLAVFLLAALAVMPASAAYVTTGGKIIVENAQIATYNAYKILDMEVNPTTGAYRYVVNAAWQGFIEANDGEPNTENDWFAIDGNYVTAKYSGSATDDVAKAAAEYALANGIDPIASKHFDVGGDLELATDVACGYYLLTSDVGTLCALGTMLPVASGTPSITLREKNAVGGLPTIEKTIDGVTQSFAIGDDVSFTITVTAEEDGQDYVVHDTMTDLELTGSDPGYGIVVKHDGTPLTKDTDYTLTVSGTCGCSFEVAISNDVDMEAYDEITIQYTATVIGANPLNEATLTSEGNDPVDPPGPGVTPYLPTFYIYKTDNTNALAGAQFKLYEADGTTEIGLVLDGDTYRPATGSESPVDAIVTGNTGIVAIKGLAAGSYVLKEIAAPTGYVKLNGNIELTLTAIDSSDPADGKLDSTVLGLGAGTPAGVSVTGDTVTVVNTTGSLLPETGGVGTTIFYVAGLVLVLGAVTLLVTKKRANA